MFQCIVQPRHDWPAVDNNAFNGIRAQLSEQNRLLEARAEATAGVANELQDYCKRRAELENDYARALEKLVRVAQNRNRDQRHKREHWPLVGAYGCWQTILENTRSLSKDHFILAELYGGKFCQKIQRCADDVIRLHRRCKDMVLERQAEVGGVLSEVVTACKVHTTATEEWRNSAAKLRYAFDQKQKLLAAESAKAKKTKALDKDLEKRRYKHSDCRSKALRARTDYVLCLEAANATLSKYYLDDIPDAMMCVEIGFNECVGRVLRTAAEADNERAKALCSAAHTLLMCVEGLDSIAERQRFVDAHSQIFALPRRIAYQGTSPEQEDAEVLATLCDVGRADTKAENELMGTELANRLIQLETNLRHVQAEYHELGKTLDAAEIELMQQMEGPLEQWSVDSLFGGGSVRPALTALVEDLEARREQEDYYLEKYREYIRSSGHLNRLTAKAVSLRGTQLPHIAPSKVPPPPEKLPEPSTPNISRRCWRNKGGGRGQFAAPLEEHLAATQRDLPLVLTSCIRVISNYGLTHQGIFRVSGSQVEMQSLRAAFERGEDPLENVRDASDINSIAGLLKLYLRELRPPILPPKMLDRMLRIASIQGEEEFIQNMRELVLTLPIPSMILLRYLFSFLSHLAEYSNENMMDEWNLAICMGPTLLAAWGDAAGGAQVLAQNQINELVKRTIQLHYDVFPQHIKPHAVYCTPTRAIAEAEAVVLEIDGADAAEGGSDEASGVDHTDRQSDYVYEDDLLFTDDIVGGEEDSLEWHQRDEQTEVNRTPRVASEERHNESVASTSQVINSGPPVPPERTSSSLGSRLAEATPDLVLDLPAGEANPAAPSPAAPSTASPTTSPHHDSSALEPFAGAADTFLQHRDTMKKKPRHSKTSSGDSGAESGTVNDEEQPTQPIDVEIRKDKVPSASGSPVPARNTARVAAKFAELTLTGGSLKPSLAAKPALLRRPAPHPQSPNSKLEPPS